MKSKRNLKLLSWNTVLNACLIAGGSMAVASQVYAFSTADRVYDWRMDQGGDCWFFGKTENDPLCRAKKDNSSAKVVTSTRDAASVVPAPLALDTGGLFEIGSSELKAGSKNKVIDLAKKIKNEKPNARELSVAGYADPSGPMALNQQLSELRAASVKEVFVEEGVRSASIRTEGRGAQDAVVTLDDCQGKTGASLSSCLAPNRRIEVNVF